MIDVGENNVIIVAPIYNKIDKLAKIENFISKNTILILNGDVCYPYENIQEIENRISVLDAFIKKYSAHYLIGNKDLLYLSNNKYNNFIKKWVDRQKLTLTIKFNNNTTTTILHGGITKSMKSFDDLNTLEVCFVDKIDNKLWHEYYNGRFGDIISSNPNSNEGIKFFNHSISLDNLSYETDKLYIIEYDKYAQLKYYYV